MHQKIGGFVSLFATFILVLGSVMYFTNEAAAGGGGITGTVTVEPTTSGVDNIAGAASTRWTFSGNFPAPLATDNQIIFVLPSSDFSVTDPSIVGINGFGLKTQSGSSPSGVVSGSPINGFPTISGFAEDTVASGTAFSITLDGINNTSLASSSMRWMLIDDNGQGHVFELIGTSAIISGGASVPEFSTYISLLTLVGAGWLIHQQTNKQKSEVR